MAMAAAAARWQVEEQKLRCTKEPYLDDAGTDRIKSIQFSTLSGNEVRGSADVQVWNNRFYDATHKPVPGGLLDTRMGATNKFGECTTCYGSYTECPGHFGYIKLCRVLLTDEKLRQGFLKKMRNPRAEAQHRSNIAKDVREKCRPCRCPYCGFLNGVAKKGPKSGGLNIVHDCSKTLDGNAEELRSALSHKKEKLSFTSVHLLDPRTVLSLFKRITDEDCELLNLGDRPEKLIITEIAVPPVPIRPSVFAGGSKRIGGKNFNFKLLNISIVMPPVLLLHKIVIQKVVALFKDSKGRQVDFVGICRGNVPSTLEGLSYLLTQT